jgi:dimethylargininase
MNRTPIAITRKVPRSISRCELTHRPRTEIDYERACHQHSQYERVLEELGCRVVSLDPLDEMPDSVFVEDTAVILDELALITRPGAASRRGEVDSIRETLRPRLALIEIEQPGTLDGGDVLRAGRTIWVGLSSRTNQEAVDQMRTMLEPYDYEIRCVDVFGCLHLKSAVTLLRATPEPILLLNPKLVDPRVFAGIETIAVDPSEDFAANALLVGETVICAEEAPRTRRRLERAGLTVVPLQTDELARAEGGLTCCSLLLQEAAG